MVDSRVFLEYGNRKRMNRDMADNSFSITSFSCCISLRNLQCDFLDKPNRVRIDDKSLEIKIKINYLQVKYVGHQSNGLDLIMWLTKLETCRICYGKTVVLLL